jgi:acetyl-CoA carboxylase biotin carboxylase subunit
MTKITKILVANRGEIAVRIMHTAKKMGIPTVAIYAEADRKSLHVQEADEAICIGEIELHETYLNVAKIMAVAKETGCNAIHPGYGFLAENPLFVEACDNAGIIFIGPGATVMRIMGNKITAREFVKNAGVPVTEGLTGKKDILMQAGTKTGFPVLLKAASGGGGKGMKIVWNEKELEEAIESTSRQAMAYFGDDTIYIEKYLDEPRHIEFQIFGDNHGNVIHLFERECSIQRRYQKIIEESPSPTLTPELRKEMGAAAVRIGKEIGYTNAGTIEFLVDKKMNFYFLEMNTRIQVEHPVTEMVTGIDVVEEQILIAEGHPLRLKQETLTQTGHAIECRIYAEDPENNFMPSPGNMSLYKEPLMDHIRIDKGITIDSEITSSYDPMICKLVSWGIDREEARKRMIAALREYVIHGIHTNILFLSELLTSRAFISNAISTKFCDEHSDKIIAGILKAHHLIPMDIPLIGYLIISLGIRDNREFLNGDSTNIWNSAGFWREQKIINIKAGDILVKVGILVSQDSYFELSVNDTVYRVKKTAEYSNGISFFMNNSEHTIYYSNDTKEGGIISFEGYIFKMHRQDFLPESISPVRFELSNHSNEVFSPMPGKVTKIFVNEGEKVRKGEGLLIIEAMKMENTIVSPVNGMVSQINVVLNDRIDPGKAVIILEKETDSEKTKMK